MTELNIDCIIGIDPGASGGIALWRPNAEVKVIKMPKDLMELRDYFEYVKEIASNPVVFIEKVQMRPDDVLPANSPQEHRANMGKAYRIQKMLEDFQKLKTIIEFADIPYIQVHPMSWQSYLHLRKKGEDKQTRKNRYKAAAGEYYPTIKATLWNSDALLIMHFGRMKKIQDPKWILENLPKRIHDKIAL